MDHGSRTYVPLFLSFAGNEGDLLQIAELMSEESSKTAFFKRITESMSEANENVNVTAFSQPGAATFSLFRVHQKQSLRKQPYLNMFFCL
ncbi:hypothetical protein [Texcoconibacillus texcoconensis]|uniref:Uncharacterized protein n=1 Tax=Texcoconibacillus texcoconensis TaxID=1095777 RepID=A0A840QNX9_9BACI|nr:hypothetical protein [Texcoconibacillus texcoconensis]MBB5173074.1 hypothetical protein [Texcoconibacillus texcoconensis]